MARNKGKTENLQSDNKTKAKDCVNRIISFNVCAVVTSLIIMCIAIVSYKVYEEFTYVPDLPDIDLDVWWGPEVNGTHDKSIRPYRIVFSEAMQKQLTQKFDLYRGSIRRKSFDIEDVAWTYGIHSEALGQVFAHWQYKYIYRERQRFLNQFDHFKTNIQGLDIHFLHVKPKVEQHVKVYPLLLLHGWPSSIREFYEVIPLLTNIRPGYNFVFEIIAPSLPGFIFSQASVKPGLNLLQTAILMRNLMQRLGFKQYYIQGGDFGHVIGSHMSTIFPKEVLGFHTNFPVNFSKFAQLGWILGAIWPTLVENQYTDRMYPLTEKIYTFLEEYGYMHLQGTKPDTIGIALQDSPMGLAAYILDRFMVFTDPNNKHLPDGGLSNYKMTDLLDNVVLYWFSGSITSSLRLYKEEFVSQEEKQILAKIPTSVLTWGLRLKHELIYQPDFILRWKYPNLVGSTTLDEGGHYAAFEKPEIVAEDVFKAVKSFLKFNEINS